MESLIVKINIDGKVYEIKSGKNLLEASLALGLNVPHFCYHAALGSVGACRQCAVKKFKDAGDTKGRIVMSCMEPVTEGLIVSIEDEEAKAFRSSVLEGLMTNHPHDCPVCDEGGECHLQDMTVMTGHNYRRFDFKKRTFKNQNLGPFINHEMNRCIECYRCVRFYKDYAGGKDFNVFAAHNNVYFGRHEDGTLENEFSGNLVEVCPTGVFTDKTLKKHYTRKWDLTNAPSVCTLCSVGCNIIVGERYGSVRRVMSRYNGSVNGYFICDRGRFGYEFVNSEKRIRSAMVRPFKKPDAVKADENTLTEVLKSALSSGKRVAGIGSPRASLEANYALSVLVGENNFFHGVSESEFNLTKTAINILQTGIAHSPSLKEIEKADVILILGEDLTNTAPMTALAVRQASRNKAIEQGVKAGIPHWHDFAQRLKAQDLKSPVFIAVPYRTKLDELTEISYHASPDDIARLGYSVAAILNGNAPGIKDQDDEMKAMANKIASELAKAKNPLIISGIHSGSKDIIQAAANIAWSLISSERQASLTYVFPECNSMGLALMEGKSFEELIPVIDQNGIDTIIILENDIYRRTDGKNADTLFDKCKNTIVLDSIVNETTEKADILLPVATFTESEGTIVNNEGRAQRYYRVLPQENSVTESWRQLKDLNGFSGKSKASLWLNFDHVVSDMTSSIPALSGIKGHMPDADFRMLNEKIKRQTIRFSGRTAMNANIAVSEPKPPEDPDSPLAFSMEGANEVPPSSLVPYYWLPGWNSAQSMNFYLDELNGSLKGGDPGVRLIETKKNFTVSFFEANTGPFRPKTGQFMVVPVYAIFGSEELSAQSPSVAERIPTQFLMMNSLDAQEIGLKENEIGKIDISNTTLQVIVKTDDSLTHGIAGLSSNLPGAPFVDLPEWGTVYK
jgi:NADH-quinone oxidoreductase subunit G